MVPKTRGLRPAPALAALPTVLAAALIGLLSVPATMGAQELRVGSGERFSSISEAIALAGEGDTLVVTAGTYHERLLLERPVALVGEDWPVLDGDGGGHVIEAHASLYLRGFVIRGSGTSVDKEHAGVMIQDAPSHIEGNRLEDVYYGIYLKNASGSVVRGNRIEGKPLPRPRRGDGIRLWYSSNSRILDNRVIGTRDVVIFFSDSLLVRGNVIERGRYGLHYMYSDHNVFERNRFDGNEVGAFLMYSADILLHENTFANSTGSTGMGLGLKDADAIRVTGNLFVGNGIGIHLDNSPSGARGRNVFTENLLLGNKAAVRLLPSVRANDFEGNDFVDNGSPVVVAGGANRGQAAHNLWARNYWSEYAGFDQNADGLGDTPFLHARLADDLLSRHPALGLFAMSPALGVLEVISRFFPFLKPEPVVVDSVPRVATKQLERWTSSGSIGSAGNAGAIQAARWLAVPWLLLGAVAGGALWRVARVRRS